MPTGLPDKHDARTFLTFAKLNADGTVAATIDVADTQPPPADHEGAVFIDVTDLLPLDVQAVVVDPAQVAAVTAARLRLKAPFIAAKRARG